VTRGGDRERLLRRLAEQFAAAVADGSEVHEVPGFRVHLWPAADPFYRNVAIPVREAGDWRGAIAAMARTFEDRGRTPRLEFFAELWPDLAAALEADGFGLERRGEVMACGPLDLAPLRASPVAPRPLAGDESRSRLAAFLAGAAEAFAEQAAVSASGELERFADGLRRGALAAAMVPADREATPVSGATLIGAGGVAELAGVWTRAGWRRRGHARAACALLLERFFAEGGEVVWLSAGDAASAGLYRGLGFWPCGTQLNYARPGAPA
jgi:ribosomal protein S18 acetylase RimI-like enzyme